MTAYIIVDSDPSKVDVGGYTKGDVLAANAAGNLTPVPIGTNTEVLTADSAETEGVEWAPSAGGGGVTSFNGRTGVVVPAAGDYAVADVTGLTAQLAAKQAQVAIRQAYITTGNVVIPNTAGVWTALPGFELQIPAAVGDYVDIGASFFVNPNGGTPFMDIGVLVGSSIVRAMSSGTATPAVEGMPGWYPTTSFRTNPAPMGFTVTAPDLDGGNIRWAIITNGNGVGNIFASAAGPFYWRSVNWKVVA